MLDPIIISGKREVDTNELFRQVSQDTGYPVGAIQFTLNALNMAMQDSSMAEDGNHVNADSLSKCLLETVIDWFGPEAEETLREWKLQRSENLGELVYGLIDAGLTKFSEEDDRSDFDGLFDLDKPQTDWRLQWPNDG